MYFKHKKTGGIYERLFEAINKTNNPPFPESLCVVYKNKQGDFFVREYYEFYNKFELCNPPVNWKRLYALAIKGVEDDMARLNDSLNNISQGIDRYAWSGEAIQAEWTSFEQLYYKKAKEARALNAKGVRLRKRLSRYLPPN